MIRTSVPVLISSEALCAFIPPPTAIATDKPNRSRMQAAPATRFAVPARIGYPPKPEWTPRKMSISIDGSTSLTCNSWSPGLMLMPTSAPLLRMRAMVMTGSGRVSKQTVIKSAFIRRKFSNIKSGLSSSRCTIKGRDV